MFLERVKSNLEIINDTELEIIRFMTKNQYSVKNMSIRTIADNLYIAPNTIIRFAKKLGYSGFSELKFEFSHDYQAKPEKKHKLVSYDDNYFFNCIQRTDQYFDIHNALIILKKISNSQRVVVFGVGDSDYYASVLVKNFGSAVDNIVHVDKHYEAKNIVQEDCDFILLLISASGENRDTVELMEIAAERNIETVSITGDSTNTLCALATHSFQFGYTLERIAKNNVSSLAGATYLIEKISRLYWEMHDIDIEK